MISQSGFLRNSFAAFRDHFPCFILFYGEKRGERLFDQFLYRRQNIRHRPAVCCFGQRAEIDFGDGGGGGALWKALTAAVVAAS